MNDVSSWIDAATSLNVALVATTLIAVALVRRTKTQRPRSVVDLVAVAEAGLVIAVDVHPDGTCALTARDLSTGAARNRIIVGRLKRDDTQIPLRVLGAVGSRLWCGHDDLGLHVRDAASLEVMESQAAVCARSHVKTPLASWRTAQTALLDTGEVRAFGADGRRVTLRPGVDGPVARPETWRPAPTPWILDTAEVTLQEPRFQAGTDAESVEEAMVEFEERRRIQAETRLAVAAGFCLPVRYEPDLPDGSLLIRYQVSVDDPRVALACLTPQAVRWSTQLGLAGQVQVAATGAWVLALVTPDDHSPPELFALRAASGEPGWRARL